MNKRVSVLLVGIGGYGSNYVNLFLDNRDDTKVHIAGAVDPYPQNQPRLKELIELGVPVYATMEEFYKKHTADLALISTPIQFHKEHVCYALSKGSSVLCEKPISATPEDAYQMIEARNKTGKILSIGYQWSYSEAVQNLKKDVRDGLFGKPLRFKTLLLWPRTDKYFSRSWAGKLKDHEGRWVMDSICNNATAHYIHNMFYILGEKTDESAEIKSVTAELYRANPIETFDTAAMRVTTESGVEIMYWGTHAVNELLGPVFHYEFEKADIVYGYPENPDKNEIIACFHDGKTKNYGNPNQDQLRKVWMAIDAVNGDAEVLCGAEAALPHAKCISGIHKSVPEPVCFPEEMVQWDENMFDGQSGYYVKELPSVFKAGFENWALPSEMGVSWARSGKKVFI